VVVFGEFLRRFRGGVPGAPSAAGVPVDRRAELAAELAPVFDALEGQQRTAVAIVAGAAADAERRRTAGAAQTADLVAQARADAAAEQAAAAAERHARSEAERRAVLAAAVAEAARVDAAAGERVPVLVDALVRRVLEPTP